MNREFVVVVLAVFLYGAAVDSQEQEAEFIPNDPTRSIPGRPLVITIQSLPDASSKRPSIRLFDIIKRTFSGSDNFFGDDRNHIPFYDIDRPETNEDQTPVNIFPFPNFPTFTKPKVPSFEGFDDFFNSFIPRIPQGPVLPSVDINLNDLPDNYNNKTHTVETIDGNRVEVNSTIKKDGNSFFQFHVVQFRPTDKTSGTPQVPEDVDTTSTGIDGTPSKPSGIIPTTLSPVSEAVPEVTTTPYEDFGEKHDRTKRFVFPNFITRYFGGKKTEAPSYISTLNSPSNYIDENPSYETVKDSPVLVDISGDTRVNYLARNVESEALVDDVEIFDWDLVREEARRNGFNNNLQSQPLKSETLKAHPMGILSVMSEPITAQTGIVQPMNGQSISHKSARSESLGLGIHPVSYQSARTRQMQTQPLKLQNDHQIPASTYNKRASSHSIRHERHRIL